MLRTIRVTNLRIPRITQAGSCVNRLAKQVNFARFQGNSVLPDVHQQGAGVVDSGRGALSRGPAHPLAADRISLSPGLEYGGARRSEPALQRKEDSSQDRLDVGVDPGEAQRRCHVLELGGEVPG